jgi:hypothetical protein
VLDVRLDKRTLEGKKRSKKRNKRGTKEEQKSHKRGTKEELKEEQKEEQTRPREVQVNPLGPSASRTLALAPRRHSPYLSL